MEIKRCKYAYELFLLRTFTAVILPRQVHALNILQALFKDTSWGENIMPYIADGIQAATLGCMSPLWAES